MKIAKVGNVKTPTRGTAGSAGLDFYIPETFDRIELLPGEGVNIPSCISANIPTGHVLIAFNKSGVAVNQNLQVGACVVDEDYQGEIHLHVTNVGNSIMILTPGQKLVQFVLLPVCYPEVECVDWKDLFTEETERGTGGFGSTGLE